MPYSNYTNYQAGVELEKHLSKFGNFLFRFGGLQAFSSPDYSLRLYIGKLNPVRYAIQAVTFCLSFIWAMNGMETPAEIRKDINNELFRKVNRSLYPHRIK